MPAVFTYSKKILFVMVFLAMVAAFVSTRLQFYPVVFATGAVIFMALNALAALLPLYIFRGKKNPFTVYLMGMVVRLALVGIAMILLLTIGKLDQNALLSITLTAMVSFVAYLAVEIHHFIRHNAGFLGT